MACEEFLLVPQGDAASQGLIRPSALRRFLRELADGGLANRRSPTPLAAC